MAQLLQQRIAGKFSLFLAGKSPPIQIPCQDQEEIDKYWEILTTDGGVESQTATIYTHVSIEQEESD